MNRDDQSELEQLRSQAYGRGDGLAGDEPAQSRLSHLEGIARRTDSEKLDRRNESITPWYRGKAAISAAWILSLAIIGVGSAFLALASASPDQITDGGAQQVATMNLDPDFKRAGEPDARGYDDYLGLAAFSVPALNGFPGDVCLTVHPAEPDADSGDFYFGCGGGDAFPPTVVVPVTDTSPSALRDAHPRGAHLQFRLTDSGIKVYSDTTPLSSAAR